MGYFQHLLRYPCIYGEFMPVRHRPMVIFASLLLRRWSMMVFTGSMSFEERTKICLASRLQGICRWKVAKERRQGLDDRTVTKYFQHTSGHGGLGQPCGCGGSFSRVSRLHESRTGRRHRTLRKVRTLSLRCLRFALLGAAPDAGREMV